MTLSAKHSDIGSDGRYFYSGLPLMVFWWGDIFSQGPRTDFNNGPGNNSNRGCILGLWRLFESDSNDGPPRPLQSCVRWKYFCSSVPLMVSWWVQYLAKGPRPDSSNGPGITRIVAAFLPFGVYSRSTGIMAPPQAIPILVRWKILLFSCPLLVSR